MTLSHHRLRLAPLAALLLLLAGLIPHGWMPRAAAGAIEIAICTAGGAISAVVDVGNGNEEAPDSDRAPPPCAFACAGPACSPPPAAEPTASIGLYPAAAPATGPPAPIRAAPALRLPPPHAPPASA